MRRGQFVGVSPKHSSTVGRILNVRTGHVSPQFHVVFDDLFTSVPSDGAPEGVIGQTEIGQIA